MKVTFGPNKRPLDVINPYVTYQEIQDLQRGIITVTPNTVMAHTVFSTLSGRLAYNVLSWAISRGLPIGPLVPYKQLMHGKLIRSVSSPVRYAPYYAPVAVAAVAATAIHKGHRSLAPGSQGSRSDNKAFWTSVSQAMTGGFGTGGWQP